MPTVRRGSGSSGERDSSSINSRGRVPTARRRQIQQAAMAAKKHQPRPKPNPNINEDKPTPLLLKILSWLGIILLCFVLGYLGTSWFVDFLNRKLLLKPENRIENQEDLNEFNVSEQERILNDTLKNPSENVKQISLNLYHVKNDTIAETRQNFVSRTPEDNIRDAVSAVVSLSGMPQAEKIKLLHVFRLQDTAFLDMSGQFASSIESAGQRKSLLLLTGIVRTVQENFSPISQIRFLIDSKPPKSGGTVDLSAPWKMPAKNS
ncbi:MAG: GerMN domain-containing protein [Synergistaceae bacterium]|nr:GerMN domain-containing protein [Synergistaceae bacterium]